MNDRQQMQDVFTKVWEHFVTKEQPLAYRIHELFGHAVCAYGSPNVGARCAIGIFDTSGQLTEFTCPVEDIPYQNLPSALYGLDTFFLTSLQGAHDSAASLFVESEEKPKQSDLMKKNLAELADHFDLVVPNE